MLLLKTRLALPHLPVRITSDLNFFIYPPITPLKKSIQLFLFCTELQAEQKL